MHDSDVSSEESQNELCIKIDSLEQTPAGIVKITTPTGSIFLLREVYLEHSRLDDFYEGCIFQENDVEAIDLLESTLCLVVERAAMNYLNRSEHSSWNKSLRIKSSEKFKSKKYWIIWKVKITFRI